MPRTPDGQIEPVAPWLVAMLLSEVLALLLWRFTIEQVVATPKLSLHGAFATEDREVPIFWSF